VQCLYGAVKGSQPLHTCKYCNASSPRAATLICVISSHQTHRYNVTQRLRSVCSLTHEQHCLQLHCMAADYERADPHGALPEVPTPSAPREESHPPPLCPMITMVEAFTAVTLLDSFATDEHDIIRTYAPLFGNPYPHEEVSIFVAMHIHAQQQPNDNALASDSHMHTIFRAQAHAPSQPCFKTQMWMCRSCAFVSESYSMSLYQQHHAHPCRANALLHKQMHSRYMNLCYSGSIISCKQHLVMAITVVNEYELVLNIR